MSLKPIFLVEGSEQEALDPPIQLLSHTKTEAHSVGFGVLPGVQVSLQERRLLWHVLTSLKQQVQVLR